MIGAQTAAAREGLRRAQGAFVQAVELTVRGAVEAAGRHAHETQLFQDRSGDTRGSIRAEVSGLVGHVEAGGAAKFLEDGTKPHMIAAHGRALAFVVNGQTLFRTFVQHPGTAPRPFMHEARDYAEAQTDILLREYVGSALRGR